MDGILRSRCAFVFLSVAVSVVLRLHFSLFVIKDEPKLVSPSQQMPKRLHFALGICPPPPSVGGDLWREFSGAFQRVLRALLRHRSYEPNCDVDLTIAVLGVDTVSRDWRDEAGYNPQLHEQL